MRVERGNAEWALEELRREWCEKFAQYMRTDLNTGEEWMEIPEELEYEEYRLSEEIRDMEFEVELEADDEMWYEVHKCDNCCWAIRSECGVVGCCNCGDDFGCPSMEDILGDIEEEPYTPSATRGDYSPSNPWDAPGMSISDFI